MLLLFLDFETRSKVDIRKHGLYRYAADPSTLPLMLAYGTARQQEQWVLPLPHDPATIPDCPTKLVQFIAREDVEFHAHNAAFEIAIWDEICVGRWGWPEIALERWHCTAARAASNNQPRSLDGVTRNLKLSQKKSKTGKDLIRMLSVPTKAQKTAERIVKGPDRKTKKDANGRVIKEPNKLSLGWAESRGYETFDLTNDKGQTYTYFFREDPDLMKQFQEYNVQDIVAEIEAHKAIPNPHELERPLWILDQQINQRGIPVDLDLCRGAVEVYAESLDAANTEVNIITNGAVETVTQRDRIIKWMIEERGVNWGETLRDGDITKALKTMDLPKDVRTVLELRQYAGGSAVKKYQATLDAVSEDGRARGQILYYGATTTGRWAGRGIQPHNFKRKATLPEDFVDVIKTGKLDEVKALGEICGMTVQDILQGCLRGIICAPEGKTLLFSDFAGIESRVLNWICGNEKKLQLFREGQDAYIHTALDVYDVVNEADIANWSEEKGKWVIKKEHKEKRQIGKACELGLGYGMGWQTFKKNAADAGSALDDEFACRVVNKWRSANPQIPQFWWDIQQASWDVVRGGKPNKPIIVNGLRVFLDSRDYLCIQLPSGRCLRYFEPRIRKDKRDFQDGDDPTKSRLKLFYRDGGKTGHGANQMRIDTYGGKLTENIVQAIARDLLVNSMLIIAEAGVPIIFHVHDEVVTEVDEHDSKSFGIVHEAMEIIPSWAQGLPLEAETQVSRRFTK